MGYRNTVLLSQRNLNILNITKDEVIVKAKFGPSIPTRIPLYLDDKLAYFTAAIIGDGHIAKDAYHITIECTDKEIIMRLKSICSEIFYRDFNFSSRIRENRKKTYTLVIDSKAIYNLLNLALEIPSGKKSSIVKVPNQIHKSKEAIKYAFFLGIFHTEGGKRGKGYGLSTASMELSEGIYILLNEMAIKVHKDSWVYKKYKKRYYGLSFKKRYLEQINAGMPEWSNGLILKSKV